MFHGTLVESQKFGLIIKFTSRLNAETWYLVNVYGSCDQAGRDSFVHWIYNLSIPFDENWLLLRDFNFIRSLDNRNLLGGDINDMFIFNEVIGHLGLLELPIKGSRYTWSNMQGSPLLEQLDWFFYLIQLDILLSLVSSSSPC